MGIIVKEVVTVPILSKEEIERTLKNYQKPQEPLTPEQKAKREQLAERMKKTTYAERRADRMKEDLENGFM